MGNKRIYKGHNLVFIVACPRSGTSWLQRMLIAYDSRIKTGPESFIFKNYIAPQIKAWDKGIKNDRPDLPHYLTRDEFISKLRNYTVDLLDPMINKLNNGDLFIEKSSSHAIVLNTIQEMLPESKIINIIRDPRDVVASWLAASRTWAKGKEAKSARELATFWKECILCAEEVKSKSTSNKFLELRYEILLIDTFETLSGILRFLGFSVDKKKLNKVIQDHQIEKMKKGVGYQRLVVKGEIGGKKGKVWNEPVGFFRKGKIGSWKEDLTLWEKYQVWKVSNKLMKKLNYN